MVRAGRGANTRSDTHQRPGSAPDRREVAQAPGQAEVAAFPAKRCVGAHAEADATVGGDAIAGNRRYIRLVGGPLLRSDHIGGLPVGAQRAPGGFDLVADLQVIAFGLAETAVAAAIAERVDDAQLGSRVKLPQRSAMPSS